MCVYLSAASYLPPTICRQLSSLFVVLTRGSEDPTHFQPWLSQPRLEKPHPKTQQAVELCPRPWSHQPGLGELENTAIAIGVPHAPGALSRPSATGSVKALPYRGDGLLPHLSSRIGVTRGSRLAWGETICLYG